MNNQHDQGDKTQIHSSGFKKGEREAIFTMGASQVPASVAEIISSSMNPVLPREINCYSTGKWTPEEHEKFLHALDTFGLKWPVIQRFVPTRSGVQIRSHAQKYFQRKREAEIAAFRSQANSSEKKFFITRECAKKPKDIKLFPEEELLIETYLTCLSLFSSIRGKKESYTEPTKSALDFPPLGLVPDDVLNEINSSTYTKQSLECSRIEALDLDNLRLPIEEASGYPFAEEPSMVKNESENEVANLLQDAEGAIVGKTNSID